MANVTRWEPFADLARRYSDFDDLFKGFFLPVRALEDRAPTRVKLDVTEDDAAYTIHAEIPGVKKDDIKVAIDGNQVSISAEVKEEQEKKEGKRVLRSERYYGNAYRSFTLAQDIDEAASSAKYADGVLELKLAKKTGSKTKELAVR